MAVINSPQVISFSNALGRPGADRAVRLYWWAKETLAAYNANGIAGILDGFAGVDTLGDGAAADGRTVLTKNDLLNLVSNLQTIVTNFEAGSNAVLNVFTRPSVNGQG